MTKKLPHVGLRLPDMAERSMPEQDGLTWSGPTMFDSIRVFAETVADGEMAMREPIRVVAEVGDPIPEIEDS